ncbi:MAG: hypothetical protein HQM08_03360 [Candidatus Riflebacteria bacterium]|nr:hypothetical protein [Candidatus Riflebacteria bacterium]
MLKMIMVSWIETPERYMLSLCIVLLFGACINLRRRFMFILLGLFIPYACFFEFAQLIYAIPGCMTLLIGLFFLESKECFFETLRQLRSSAALSLVLIGILLILIAKAGAFHELNLFFSNLDNMTLYSIYKAGVLEWFDSPLISKGFILLLIFSLFIYSLWFSLIKNNVKKNIIELIPFAIAVLSITAFQKQLLRPTIEKQIFIFPLTGLAILFAQTSSVIVVLIALVISFLIIPARTPLELWEICKRPATLVQDIQSATQNEAWRAKEEAYFAPQAFINDGKNGLVLHDNLLKKMNLKKKDDFFDLGDDAYLYIILQQQAPFYISIYNQSILFSQKNTLAWLEEHKPNFIIWKKSFLDFDWVPNTVRVPLLFDYVMKNYSYFDQEGSFLIFKRQTPEFSNSLDFWSTYLGSTIDLGFIPGGSKPKKFLGSSGENFYQTNFVKISVLNPVSGRERKLLVSIQGKPYCVKFSETEYSNTYYIQLNRIWFYQLAQYANLPIKIELEKTNQDSGISINLEPLVLTKEILY